MLRPERMQCEAQTNGVDGRVVWASLKSLWFSAHAAVALIAGPLTANWEVVALSAGLTVLTLCCGHSVGIHRLLIHRSFETPKWLERCLVFLGVLVGMGGPRRMIYLHESRDWCQRQPQCHPFYIHQSGVLKDAYWNLHCECRLSNPPTFQVEAEAANDRFYRLLDRCWMAAQLPLAAVLFAIGGLSWCVWGISVRIVVSLIGHWGVGYLAHNFGERDWHVEGASVQGFNVRGFGLLTMGEAWHNNHHAFPESARLGLKRTQPDPGWWFVLFLKSLGLVWNVKLPEHHPKRVELVALNESSIAQEPHRDTTSPARQPAPARATSSRPFARYQHAAR